MKKSLINVILMAVMILSSSISAIAKEASTSLHKLYISKTVTSCYCTHAVMICDTIPPNEIGALKMSVYGDKFRCKIS